MSTLGSSGILGEIDSIIDQAVASGDSYIDLPKASNIVQWFETPGYLFTEDVLSDKELIEAGGGQGILYPSQYKIMVGFFELLCPFCNVPETLEWLQSEDFLNEGPVPRAEHVLLEYGTCPKCGITKPELHRKNLLRNYQEMVLVLGMRASKTFIASGIAAFMVHYAVLERNLQRHFRLLPMTPVEMAFTASSAEQTRDTIWAYITNHITDSPWFKRYAQLTREKEAKIRVPKDTLFSIDKTKIVFAQNKLNLIPYSSNSGSIAGRTRVACFLDELARFDTTDSKRGADEVYRVLERSLKTVRGNNDKIRSRGDSWPFFEAIMCTISSPLDDEDRVMRLKKEAKLFPNKRIYALHMAVWDFNPTQPYENFEADMEADPVGTMRDFGAQPLGAKPRLIPAEYKAKVEACISGRGPIVVANQEPEDISNATGLWKVTTLKLLSVKKDRLRRYNGHIDAGRNKDSFCMTFGHREGSQLQNFKFYVDSVIEIRPGRGAKDARPVHFPSVFATILDIARALNVGKITYDRWQSTHQIQALRDAGIYAEELSITPDIYRHFRADVYEGRVSFLSRESLDPKQPGCPMAKALWELMNLEDTGVRVEHTRYTSDDVIQSVVGAYWNSVRELHESLDGLRANPTSPPRGWVPVTQNQFGRMGLGGQKDMLTRMTPFVLHSSKFHRH